MVKPLGVPRLESAFVSGGYFCISRYNFATAFSVHGTAQVFSPINGGLILAGGFSFLGSKMGMRG